MKNVSSKPDSLRRAVAGAVLRLPADCIPLLAERRTDKGDALAAARIAGIMAGKRTCDIIPLCHPLPIHELDVVFDLGADTVTITAHAETIAPTGVEMEALTAATVAGLTLYDMLKPHAGTNLELGSVRLHEKRGGKSHYRRNIDTPARAAVLVLSDRVSAGPILGLAGELVRARLVNAGIEVAAKEVLPDEPAQITARAQHWLDAGVDLLISVGGTGVDARDNARAALQPLLERELPGLLETARAFGQRRMPYAMLSNGIAGMAGETLIVTFPGSRGGASEFLDALLPGLIHAIEVRKKGSRASHDH
ncbi:MAG: bifunctional molybdenum cofactor biosynthesis protein MoaC/MoaB [Salinisphaera sp.]|nr:bifunctional molybdenum cofactor biosynthesis protein MoaC/MoaB [Salinisphaera sp.]